MQSGSVALKRDFKVLVLGKIDGGMSRYRTRRWLLPIEGGASLDEFCPGRSCLPVSTATTVRLGSSTEEWMVEGLG